MRSYSAATGTSWLAGAAPVYAPCISPTPAPIPAGAVGGVLAASQPVPAQPPTFTVELPGGWPGGRGNVGVVGAPRIMVVEPGAEGESAPARQLRADLREHGYDAFGPEEPGGELDLVAVVLTERSIAALGSAGVLVERLSAAGASGVPFVGVSFSEQDSPPPFDAEPAIDGKELEPWFPARSFSVVSRRPDESYRVVGPLASLSSALDALERIAPKEPRGAVAALFSKARGPRAEPPSPGLHPGDVDRSLSGLARHPKVDAAISAVRIAYGDDVTGMSLIGSATGEPTQASDFDAAVVFSDALYRARIGQLKSELAAMADDVNARMDGPVLTLWATCEDHYRIRLPDVSYVRANLPASLSRLDAWCGLAKHTLISYEVATAAHLEGSFDFAAVQPAKLPRTEGVEVFLLSTRTLAEGLAELAAGPFNDPRSGRNHVAKGGLRAAYATVIVASGKACNSYAEIATAARAELPAEAADVVDALYEAKTRDAAVLPPLADVMRLMRLCESRVAAGPRLIAEEFAPGPIEEGWWYSADSMAATEGDPEAYRRGAEYDSNFWQYAYYLVSSREVVRRLLGADVDVEALDFFLDELLCVASLGLQLPGSGLRLGIGGVEGESLDLWFRGDWMPPIGPKLCEVAGAYLARRDSGWDAPGFSLEQKRERVALVLLQLAQTNVIAVDHDVLQALLDTCPPEAGDSATEWQVGLLAGMTSPPTADKVVSVAATLADRAETARACRVLDRTALLTRMFPADDARLRERAEGAGLDVVRIAARGHHLRALCAHQDGDVAKAAVGYAAATALDPDNAWALDDYALLLFATQSEEAARDALADALAAATPTGLARRADALRDAPAGGAWAAWCATPLQVDAPYDAPFFLAAQLHEAARDSEGALVRLDRATQRPATATPAQNLRALVFEQQGRIREALGSIDEAVNTGVDDDTTHEILDRCLRSWHEHEGST